MMDRKRFGRFSAFFAVGFCYLVVCATGAKNHELRAAQLPEQAVKAADFRAELSASQVKDGSVVIVSVGLPEQLEDALVKGDFEGIQIPFFSDSVKGEYHAVLGVPYNHKSGETKISIRVLKNGIEYSKELPLTVLSGQYASETLRVDLRHLNPTKKDIKRIFRDKAEVGKIYSRLIPRKYWKGPFRFPVESAITSVYGTKRVFNGQFASFHSGLDFKAPVGTRVYASAPGKVVLAKDLFFTGNTVMVDHGYGVLTLYAHLSKIDVTRGQMVDLNTLLGLSGETGRVSGPHLHWQAVVHKMKVNPLDLTKVMK
ncbi:MAG TPA: M23 family metallopeptidase [Bdellovibrionota bacterium]|nr:M23 family metallopeptidase [Bdellovibrionota bacterium]